MAGSHALQGERSYMEDRVVTCTVEGGLFAGVFDGHSGDAAAEFCAKSLLGAATPLFGEGQYEQALSAAFSATNEAFLVGSTADDSGCTACCVLLVNGQLYVANCGDSRAVLLGADAAPLQLSVDHKPDDGQECERVEAAGSSVFDAEDGNGARVVGPKVENGDYLMLGVARSIGDRPFKATSPPLVPATPDVTRHDVSALGAKFVIVASDGGLVWPNAPPSWQWQSRPATPHPSSWQRRIRLPRGSSPAARGALPLCARQPSGYPLGSRAALPEQRCLSHGRPGPAGCRPWQIDRHMLAETPRLCATYVTPRPDGTKMPAYEAPQCRPGTHLWHPSLAHFPGTHPRRLRGARRPKPPTSARRVGPPSL